VPTKLQNTIVADDEGGNCAGTPFLDEGHNITFADMSCPGTNGDPKLGQLAANGGPTQTLALGTGSAAIDAIPATGAGCPATDQRGLPRPSGPACDAGAYEVTPPVATTGSASEITTATATVAATVTASDGDATVQFEFGTSTAYGSETPVQHVAGLSPSGMNTSLTGLTAGTTYHYRVVATSADGSADGRDETFTTMALPVLSRLKVTPAAFSVTKSGGSTTRRVHPGTTVSYVDSEAATTIFTVTQLLPGVRRGGRCIAAPKRAHHAHGGTCTRSKQVGSFTHADLAGSNDFKFSGVLSGRPLPPGRYRLAATPVAQGATGLTLAVPFRVIASPRKR
jgi:hypothetical protein